MQKDQPMNMPYGIAVLAIFNTTSAHQARDEIVKYPHYILDHAGQYWLCLCSFHFNITSQEKKYKF